MKKYLIVMLTAVTLVLTGCATSTPSKNEGAPQDTSSSLTGTWVYSKGTLNFEAEVGNGKITIYMLLDDDSKGLYWEGTFPATANSGGTITSKADSEALAGSLYGSSDSEKKFDFSNDQLSYSFTMLGVTTDVKLQKK